jgi:hypothetical protein
VPAFIRVGLLGRNSRSKRLLDPSDVAAELRLRRGHRGGDAAAEIPVVLDGATGLVASEVAGLEHPPGVRSEIAHGSEGATA